MGDTPIGNVTLKTPLPVFRSDGSSAVHNNQLYQIAGYNENGAGSPVDTMYRYTPATDSWETLTAGPRTRWGHASSVWADRIYVFGGATTLNGPPYRNQIDYYNITSPGWNTAAATMPANMTYQGMCSVTSGTHIYVMVNTTLQRYDPAGDSWTVLTGTSTHGAWGNCAVVGGFLYWLAGAGAQTLVSRYSITAGTWTASYDTTPYGQFGGLREAPVINGLIYYGWGYDGAVTFYRRMYSYEPVSKTWTRLADNGVGGDGVHPGAINGKVYVVGGRNRGGTPVPGTNFNQEYDPTATMYEPWSVETTTDNPTVASGAFVLGNSYGDSFSYTRLNATSYKWLEKDTNLQGWAHFIQSGALELKNENSNITPINYGSVNLQEALQTSSDFDLRVKGTVVSPAGVGGNWLAEFSVINQQTPSWNSGGCPTCTGLLIEADPFAGGAGKMTVYAFKVLNHATTLIGASHVVNKPDVWLRIRWWTGNTTFQPLYSQDGISWSSFGTSAFSPGASLYPILDFADGFRPDWKYDDFAITSGTLSDSPYRTSGSWTSPTQATAGEYPHRISIIASSLSATSYVDGIDILDAAANIVYSDATNFNAGTTTDYVIPYSEAVANAWSVRVNLAGDGSGTPVVESISVTTDSNPVIGGIGKRGVHVYCRITWPIQHLECVGWVDQWWKDLAGGLKESWFIVNGRIVLQNGTLKMPVADSWYIPELVSYEVVFVARSHFGISAPSLPETVTLEKRPLGFVPVFLTILAMFAVARFSVIKQHGKPEDAK